MYVVLCSFIQVQTHVTTTKIKIQNSSITTKEFPHSLGIPLCILTLLCTLAITVLYLNF